MARRDTEPEIHPDLFRPRESLGHSKCFQGRLKYPHNPGSPREWKPYENRSNDGFDKNQCGGGTRRGSGKSYYLRARVVWGAGKSMKLGEFSVISGIIN